MPDAPLNQVVAPGNDQVANAADLPGGAKFLAWYYIIGSVPFVLFALFGFTIPVEELTNHPQNIERDRAFLSILKVLMFGAVLIYSMVHIFAAIGLLKLKRWGFMTAKILSVLGIFHLNLFAVPGLVICFRKDVAQSYAE